MVGTNGTKFPGIRDHFEKNVKQVYKDMDVNFESFPEDTVEKDNKVRKLSKLKSRHFLKQYNP